MSGVCERLEIFFETIESTESFLGKMKALEEKITVQKMEIPYSFFSGDGGFTL